jgi:hypothetical protein
MGEGNLCGGEIRSFLRHRYELNTLDTMRSFRRAVCFCLALLVISGTGWAQSVGDSGDDSGPRPWADGVSEEDQRTALALFEQGNGLLADSVFVKAADKYREALAHWAHPAIHYNLALALLNLDQPIEVYENLEKAMEYGPAPLDLDKFERAKSYKQLVMKQLATIEVICDQDGAAVSMDGKPLFTGPGRYKGLVRIGEHSIIATKAGYLPTNETRSLQPGQQVQVELVLFTEEDKTLRVRRWDSWKPWAVVGTGLALGLAGGGMHYMSQKNFNDYDALVRQECPCPPGTPPATDSRDSGRTQQQIAIGAYLVGGTALATGFVLVYLNRVQLVRTDVTEASERVSILPILTSETAGVTAQLRF